MIYEILYVVLDADWTLTEVRSSGLFVTSSHDTVLHVSFLLSSF
jgi:hypothetical protein